MKGYWKKIQKVNTLWLQNRFSSLHKECHLVIASHNTDGNIQTQLSVKGQCIHQTFFLDKATLPFLLQSIENANSVPNMNQFNGKLFLGCLGSPSSSSLTVLNMLSPLPHSSPGEALSGTRRGHHTRVWSTLSNAQGYFYCTHQLTQPDYSFCNHSSEIKKRNLPTPLWASILVNSIVPLWPFLGFSW